MGWIYAIIDQVSGKTYIGQTSKNPKYRWGDHKRYGRQRRHHPLYKALYVRPDSFEFVVLVEAPNTLLDTLERDLITLGNTLHPKGYNLQEGGVALYRKTEFVRARQRGKPVSAETRAKMSANAKGRRWTAEQRELIVSKLKGRKMPREAVEKNRAKQRLRRMTDAQKEHLRVVNLGKKRTEESKAKTSAALLASETFRAAHAARRGTKASAETCAKIRAAHSTPEARERTAAQHRGKLASDETRRRMSESHLRRVAAVKAALTPEKPCTRCGKSFRRTTEFFSPDKRATDGLYPACKSCRRKPANEAEATSCPPQVKSG